MKYLKFMPLLLLACLGLASCDELTDDEDREPRLTDYVDFKVNKCERIGSVLIIDFTAKNKTKETLRNIEFDGGSLWHISTDNLGNKYNIYGEEVSILSGSYSLSKKFSLQRDESVTGRFRLKHFDPTNSATKVNLCFGTTIESVGLHDTGITFTGIKITDNRVLANGFQTPDDNLEVAWVSSRRDKSKKEAYITFTVKNTSDQSISNLQLSSGDALDNTGNSNCRGNGIKIGNGNYNYSVVRTIAAGETVTYTALICNVDNSATAISGIIGISCNSYTLCDDNIRYFDIPLQ